MAKAAGKSLIKYPGSKGAMRQRIIALMPEHRVYAEPFGGSAAVLLAKEPAKVEWYNDTYGEVLNLFRILRRGGDDLDALRYQVEMTPYSRRELDLARNRSWSPDDDPVEAARRFLVRSWLSWGGSLNNHRAGIRTCATDMKRVRTWACLGDRLAMAAERFRGVQIEAIDAVKLMLLIDGEDALFYVDPPYIEDTVNFREGTVYERPYRIDDHVHLLACLRNLKSRVILSGYRHPLYDDSLADWRRIDVPHRTQAGTVKTECLWLNYEPPAASS